jgi:hypothetical protein
MMGLKVDPLTNGLAQKNSFFSVRPSEKAGVHFVVDDIVIPYNPQTLHAIDGIFGRMLRVSDAESKVQILIVEHLLSAIRLLGLSGIEIHIGESCRAPLMSSGIPKIWFNQPTYFIPICGPGVSGYIKQLLPYCELTGEKQEEYRIQSPNTFSQTEALEGKYRGLVRNITIIPDDHFSIEVLSAKQPDIINDPDAKPFHISDTDNVRDHLRARPIMRLTSRTKAIAIWILNFRSFALTPETYFKSRPQLSREDVVARMQPQYQEHQNEHLVHTAIADILWELWGFIGNKRFLGKIILKDTNHVFRMLALWALLWENDRK